MKQYFKCSLLFIEASDFKITQEFKPSGICVDEDELFNLAICPEGSKGNL